MKDVLTELIEKIDKVYPLLPHGDDALVILRDEWPILRDAARAYLSAREGALEQEPVAWRYRYKNGGAWRYVDQASDCNPLESYEREPLYGHPLETGHTKDNAAGSSRKQMPSEQNGTGSAPAAPESREPLPSFVPCADCDTHWTCVHKRECERERPPHEGEGMTRKIAEGVFLLEQEPDGVCELCGKIDELRPYGPKGENVCFDCAMKDEAAALRAFKQRLDGD